MPSMVMIDWRTQAPFTGFIWGIDMGAMLTGFLLVRGKEHDKSSPVPPDTVVRFIAYMTGSQHRHH